MYVPMHITWPHNQGTHQLGLYYQTPGTGNTTNVWIFEPGGRADMWTRIKSDVEKAIQVFRAQYFQARRKYREDETLSLIHI